MLDIADFSLTVTVALLTAAISLFWLTRTAISARPAPEPKGEPLSLLFDKGILHHSTRSAARLLGLEPGEHDWADMRDMVLARFPDFPEQLGEAEDGGLSLIALDDDGPQKALIRWRGNLCWVTLAQTTVAHNTIQSPSDRSELDAMRRVTATAPNPIWQEDADGTVRWHNAAYASLYKQANGTIVDPRKRLFSEADLTRPGRVILEQPTQARPDWYELTKVRTQDVTVLHAICINAVVAAEEAQRNFVQTLAKTFAHLSIGLAIFDRNGQLVLFNPALLDLTGLPAPFLSARPAMLSFFDALRENRRMPEPKNYRSWRQEIADVIAAATDGRYQETWTLESGQTYSVKGRQQPDGATAFLIEDISAEMTLTRNFRTELAQAQALVDAAEDAMAIFSPTGILTLCNAAFRRFWAIDPDIAFTDVTLQDCARIWKEGCAYSADRQVIDAEMTGLTSGAMHELRLRLHDGTTLHCDMVQIPSGSLLVRFHSPKGRAPNRPALLDETV